MNNKCYALKAKERYTLRELASIFEDVTGKKLNIKWGALPYRRREVMVPWKNGEIVPEWAHKVSIKEGIKKIIK